MQPTPRIVYTIPVSIEFSLTTIVAKWILHFALKRALRKDMKKKSDGKWTVCK
jgi:hypothetical protein